MLFRSSESRLVEAHSAAVRVMTIHKSKGLDFPVVIAASLGLKNRTQAKTILADRHGLKMFAVKAGPDESGRWTEGWEKLDDGDRKREAAELARLLYVALTRARDCLVISAHTCRREEVEEGVFMPYMDGTRLEPIKAVLGKCLADEIQAGGEAVPLSIRNPKSKIQNPPIGRQIDVKKLDAFVIPKSAAADYKVSGCGIESVERQYRELRKLIENTPATDISLSTAENKISASDAGKNPSSAARRRSVRLGTAFHEVMERVDLKEQSGLADMLREAGARNNLDGAGCRKLSDMVEKCLASELMLRARGAALAGRRVLREMPFIRPLEEGGFREGRIDLLFEEEEAWTLVDYKTGRIPRNMQSTQNKKVAEDTETYFRNRYASQARAYRDALENLSIKPGGVFLLLARTGEVIEMI